MAHRGGHQPKKGEDRKAKDSHEQQDPVQLSANVIRDIMTHAQPEVDSMTKWILKSCPDLSSSTNVSDLIKEYCNRFNVPREVKSIMHGIRINGNYVRHPDLQPFQEELPYGKMEILAYQMYSSAPVASPSAPPAKSQPSKDNAKASSSTSSPAKPTSGSSSSTGVVWPEGYYKRICSAGSNCKRDKCDYWHPHQNIPPGGVRSRDNSDAAPSKECKHGNNCKIPNCKKWHPGNPAPEGGILPKGDPKAKDGEKASRGDSRSDSKSHQPREGRQHTPQQRDHHQQQRSKHGDDNSSQGSEQSTTDSRFPDGAYKRPCSSGLECKRANCGYWHPRDPLPPGGVRVADATVGPTLACKYDLKCTKPRGANLGASTSSTASTGSEKPCEFWHSGQLAPPGGIVPVQSAIARTRPCTRHQTKTEGCTFFHKDEDVPTAGVAGSDINSPEVKACPHGRQCTRIGKDRMWHPGEAIPAGGIAPPANRERGGGRDNHREHHSRGGSSSASPSVAGNEKGGDESSPSRGPRGRGDRTRPKRAGFSQDQPQQQRGGSRRGDRGAPSASGNEPAADACPEGVNCDTFGCAMRHGAARMPDCRHGTRCRNEECGLRHPEGWNPEMVDSSSTSSSTASLPSFDGEPALKTLEQRETERQEFEYAIYMVKDALVDYIENRPVVLVRGHNGSGQVTQIAQYVAESLDNSVVVQLQSDATSVRNVARQIAFEFDGCEPGKNVRAHLHGNPESIKDARIIVMTSAEFVRASSNVKWLSSVTAVICSEVHQRFRFTDLALTICMEHQKKALRPHPLRLIASSAMVDDLQLTKALAIAEPFDIMTESVYPIDSVKVRYTKNNEDSSRPGEAKTGDDDEKPEEVLAQSVLQLLNQVLFKTHRPGNVLVFVPGAGDVKRVLDQFVSLKNTMRRELKELARVQVLPLHGSQSADQQGQVANWSPEEDGDRLVVFATNFAEHFVSVPDVALVVDTGKVRKATSNGVYEDVFVSRTEADLRRAQAAVVDDGVCYRLYREADLVQDAIEPEILKADLTYLCLVLIRASFHPSEFPFISKPSAKLLDEKFRHLIKLSFVAARNAPVAASSAGPVGKLAHLDLIPTLPLATPVPVLTARGEACLELGFEDPRWAAFVMEAYERYGVLRIEQACDVAALLQQGSSIFDLRKTATEKAQLRDKQTMDTAHLDSDVQYYLQRYQFWVNTGKPNGDKCSSCGSAVSNTGDNCVKCRTAYAAEYGLDARALTTVRKESKRILGIVKHFGKEADSNSDDIFKPWSEILGRCFALSFPESIGEFLIPSNPSVGVFLPSIGDEGTFGQINRTSAMLTVAHKTPPTNFITMTQSKARGQLMLEMCHPIKLEWLSNDEDRQKLENSMLHFTLCFERANIHKHYIGRIRDLLAKTTYKRLSYVHYEPTALQLSVYAAESCQAVVRQTVADELQRAIDEDLRWEDYVPVGVGAMVTVTSGLQITDYEEDPSKLKRVKVYAPVSISDVNAFGKWICAVINCQETDIMWKQFEASQPDKKDLSRSAANFGASSASPSSHHLAASSSNLGASSASVSSTSSFMTTNSTGIWRRASYVAFRSKELAKAFRERISQLSNSMEMRDLDQETPCLEEDRRMLRSVPIHVYLPYGPAQALEALQSLNLAGLMTRRGGHAKLPKLKISNVSPADVAMIQPLLQRRVSPALQVQSSVSKDCGQNAVDLLIQVEGKDEAARCVTVISESGLLSTPVVVAGQVFHVKYDQPRFGASTPYVLKFTSPAFAQECVDKVKTLTNGKERGDAKGIVDLHIDNWHLFDDVKRDMIASLKDAAPSVKVTDSPKGLSLEGVAVSQISKAAQIVVSATSPIFIRATQLSWRLFYTQLHKLKYRTSVSRALVDFEMYEGSPLVKQVVVKGPPQSQAAALAELGDLSKTFLASIKILDMAAVFQQFKTGASGYLRLQKIIDSFKSKSVKIHVDYLYRSIAIFLPIDPANLSASAAAPSSSSPSSDLASSSTTTRSPAKQPKQRRNPKQGGAATVAADDLDPDNSQEDAATATQTNSKTQKQPKAAPSGDNMQSAVDLVQSLIRDLGGQADHESTCAFCGKASPDSCFLICGHDYCGTCLASQSSESDSAVVCPKCQTPVDVRNFKKLTGFEEVVQQSMKNQLNAPLHLVNPNLRELCVCPSSECEAIRRRPLTPDQSYSACPECRVMGCPSCGAVADSAHINQTCEAYSELLASRSFDGVLKDIFTRAETFVSGYTDTVLGKAVEWVRNPGLAAGCPSMARFVKGVMSNGGPDMLKSAFFAWHGTKSEAIAAVCHEGFNPAYRSGQVYGPGEYFGHTAAVSEGYARGSTLIIVSLILGRIREVSSHSNFCYVVKNPTDWKESYVVPVLVARFDPLRLRHIAAQQQAILRSMAWRPVDTPNTLNFDKPQGTGKRQGKGGKKSSAADASSSSGDALNISTSSLTPSDSFVGWAWYYDDAGIPAPRFEPYKAAISKQIEDAYQAHKFQSGPSKIVVQVIRYTGDLPQDYTINLQTMQQHLMSNGRVLKSRQLQRTPFQLPKGLPKWQFLDDARQWVDYDMVPNHAIETGFQSWRTGGNANLDLSLPGRPESYTIDFLQMQQKNVVHNTARHIRRKVA